MKISKATQSEPTILRTRALAAAIALALLAGAASAADLGRTNPSIPEALQRDYWESFEPRGPRAASVARPPESGVRYFKVGKITSDDPDALGALPSLQENTEVNLDQLARELFLYNRNPSHRATLFFDPVDEGGNVRVEVTRTRAYGAAIFANNSGSENELGRSRTGVSVWHDDLYGARLSYTVLTSPLHAQKMNQRSLTVSAPLPSTGDEFTYSWSDGYIALGSALDAFQIVGKTKSSSACYNRYFNQSLYGYSRASLCLDNKLSDNVVLFSGTDVGNRVKTTPLTLSVSHDSARYGFIARLSKNLPGYGDGSRDAYLASRYLASDKWTSWWAQGYLRDTYYQAELEMGGSPNSLVPLEQFGIGGARSIRGMDEKAIQGDKVMRLSLDALYPMGDNWQAKVFTDLGEVRKNNLLAGEKATQRAWGMGVGLSYTDKQLAVTTSWARAYSDVAGIKRSPRLHLEANLRY